MNQRRFIEKQNKLIEIDEIKQRVESELNVQNSQTDTEVDDVVVEEANNAIEETKVDEVEPSVIQNLAKEIWRARAEWENTNKTETPSNSKQKNWAVDKTSKPRNSTGNSREREEAISRYNQSGRQE